MTALNIFGVIFGALTQIPTPLAQPGYPPHFSFPCPTPFPQEPLPKAILYSSLCWQPFSSLKSKPKDNWGIALARAGHWQEFLIRSKSSGDNLIGFLNMEVYIAQDKVPPLYARRQLDKVEPWKVSDSDTEVLYIPKDTFTCLDLSTEKFKQDPSSVSSSLTFGGKLVCWYFAFGYVNGVTGNCDVYLTPDPDPPRTFSSYQVFPYKEGKSVPTISQCP